MKFSFQWIKELAGYKGSAESMARLLKLHAFDVKGIEGAGEHALLDIDVLPNRAADCFSHIGIAREVAALTGKKIKLKVPRPTIVNKSRMHSSVKVAVEHPQLCPRYIVCLVEGVKVKDSPAWLKKRLLMCGLEPINNVVDATNYAMLLSGQPLHAFDYDKLADGAVFVRLAKNKEHITTLHGETLELDPSVLVIADAKDPIALAGIKGGKKAEITKETTCILVEGALFDAYSVRTTSKKLNLRTDASVRFEHTVNAWSLEFGLAHVLDTLLKVSGGKLKNKYDVGAKKPYQRKVSFSLAFLERFIGQQFDEKETVAILERLGFTVGKMDVKKLLLTKAKNLIGRPYKYGVSTFLDAPDLFDCSSFTRYLFREAGIEIPRPSVEQLDFVSRVDPGELEPGDLVFLRGGRPHITPRHPDGVGHVGLYIGDGKVIHAEGKKYNKVRQDPVSLFLQNKFRGAGRIPALVENTHCALVPEYRDDIVTVEDLAEEVIRVKGYQALPSKMPLSVLSVPRANDRVVLAERVRRIYAHLGFYENYNYTFIGEDDKEHFGFPEGSLPRLKNPMSREITYLRPHLAVALVKSAAANFRFYDTMRLFEIGNVFSLDAGAVNEKQVLGMLLLSAKKKKTPGELFYEMKGYIEALCEGLGIDTLRIDEYDRDPAHFDAARTATVFLNNISAGSFGYLSPDIARAYGVPAETVIAELDFTVLLNACEEELEYAPIAKFPSVMRDLSIMVEPATKVDDVLNVIENTGGTLLVDADLLDIYEGEDEAADVVPQKSMLFRLIFQSSERTLTDEEVNKAVEEIMSAIESSGWEIKK
jgi:phenylalanyl-tRNA synthetase beta subunit